MLPVGLDDCYSQVLVVDEVSMMSAEMLECVHDMLCRVGGRSELGLAGLQWAGLVLCQRLVLMSTLFPLWLRASNDYGSCC
jgi:hypothetical protein